MGLQAMMMMMMMKILFKLIITYIVKVKNSGYYPGVIDPYQVFDQVFTNYGSLTSKKKFKFYNINSNDYTTLRFIFG